MHTANKQLGMRNLTVKIAYNLNELVFSSESLFFSSIRQKVHKQILNHIYAFRFLKMLNQPT